MLTFSRGQRGSPRSLQLGPHLTEAVKLLQSTLPSSIQIRTRFPPGLPCVLVDPLHVEQCLVNLCINARDAMQGKGTLTMALRTASGGGYPCTSCHQPVEGFDVELAVSDTGPGIPPQVLERMFEPFYSTKEVGKGNGMGLAVVHGIVHEYGGHIHVETKIGEGSTLRIWLPAWFPSIPGGAVERPVPTIPPAAEAKGPGLRVWGLAAVATGNGLEACEQFAADPDGFDLVILDPTMSRMTGLEAAEQLVRLRPTRHPLHGLQRARHRGPNLRGRHPLPHQEAPGRSGLPRPAGGDTRRPPSGRMKGLGPWGDRRPCTPQPIPISKALP